MFSSRLNKEGVCAHHMAYGMQDGPPRSPETSILHGLPSYTTWLFRSLLLSLRLDIFGLVCECIRAEYPRTVGMLGASCVTCNVDALILNTYVKEQQSAILTESNRVSGDRSLLVVQDMVY